MQQRYLEMTFRNGKALAAYLYLPRQTDDRSVRTEEIEPGLIIDFAADGRPIGIEITRPSGIVVAAINRALAAVGQPPATAEELQPLVAA